MEDGPSDHQGVATTPWWRRLTLWQYESRAKYLLLQVGSFNLLYFVLLWVFSDLSLAQSSGLTLLVTVVGIPIHGWLWYPRRKAKFLARTNKVPGPAPRPSGL